jgi:hypothetical protein
MKLSDKIFLGFSSFVISFSLGTIISFLTLTHLFANNYLSIADTPEYVVNFVCGARYDCRVNEHCGR